MAAARLNLCLTKLDDAARIPSSAHGAGEDAGMDLHAVEAVEIPPGGWASVGTGIAVEIPPGYEGQVRPRSGMARKYGVTLLNSPGTIDPGYRGELRVTLINHGPAPYAVRPGDRVAQLVVGSYASVEWQVADDLAATARGADGFGSTGR